eukprot:5473633-Alexandrium_andersonii.AAC.1
MIWTPAPAHARRPRAPDRPRTRPRAGRLRSRWGRWSRAGSSRTAPGAPPSGARRLPGGTCGRGSASGSSPCT